MLNKRQYIALIIFAFMTGFGIFAVNLYKIRDRFGSHFWIMLALIAVGEAALLIVFTRYVIRNVHGNDDEDDD